MGSKGGGEILLVPSTFHPGEASPFWLSLRSSLPLPRPEWVQLAGSFETASWRGGTKKNRLNLTLQTEGKAEAASGASATAGSLFVFLRQCQADRQPLGLHILSADRTTLVQKASFVKAAEISVEVKLTDGPLLLCPCCLQDVQEADLEVEVLAPPGCKLTLSAAEAKASTLETAHGLLASAAPALVAAAAGSKMKKGSSKSGSGKAKSTAARGSLSGPPAFGGASMQAASKSTQGLAGMYAGMDM